MKIRKLVRMLVVALFLVTAQATYGAHGCMDKGWHRYSGEPDEGVCRRPDYKELHYVGCSCPCLQYRQHEWYGECSRCGHYRRPIEYT